MLRASGRCSCEMLLTHNHPTRCAVGVDLVFKYVCSQGDKADKQVALLGSAVSAM